MSEIEKRKSDHIQLAFRHQVSSSHLNNEGLFYEPLFGKHPSQPYLLNCSFGHFSLGSPLWISSMTGGAEHAQKINQRLAKAAGHFRLGLALGSCRALLENPDKFFGDYDVKHLIGEGLPYFANFGVAQIQQEMEKDGLERMFALLRGLGVNGIVVHVNPLQEWFQMGGDFFCRAPLDTIKDFLEVAPLPVIVKEVGHGMGPRSLQALMELPLLAIEFGAFGGTNFSTLERERAEQKQRDPLCFVGHSAEEMVEFVNVISASSSEFSCRRFIISGGVQNFLQAHQLISRCPHQAIVGMAVNFLRPAMLGESELFEYIEQFNRGLSMAREFIEVKN